MKTDHIITALKPFEGWAVELDRLGPQGPQPYTPLSICPRLSVVSHPITTSSCGQVTLSALSANYPDCAYHHGKSS